MRSVDRGKTVWGLLILPAMRLLFTFCYAQPVLRRISVSCRVLTEKHSTDPRAEVGDGPGEHSFRTCHQVKVENIH